MKFLISALDFIRMASISKLNINCEIISSSAGISFKEDVGNVGSLIMEFYVRGHRVVVLS